MSWRLLFRTFFRRSRRDAELADDIRFHLDVETDDNLARGMPANVAREHARRKFGNTTLIREEVYRMHGAGFFETLWQDILYGLRQLRLNASFTAVAATTLALGVGANTAIFSVVDSVLLRPLPYQNPERLAWVTERFALSFSPGAVLGPDFVEWQKHNQVFQQIEAFLGSQGPGISLSGAGEPVPVRMTEVTQGFFSMLGVQPVLGRSFAADEGTEGHEGVAIISENLWRAQFGHNPGVLGQKIHLNNDEYTVIGVMPANLQYPHADVWTPIVLNSSLFMPQSRPMAMVSVIGRLKQGIALSQAESNLSLLTHGIDQQYPPQFVQNRDRRLDLIPLHQVLVHNVRSLLLILLGAVGFVFLIACANVANLSFSRAAGRWREFAIRGALGAARTRLVRQLLTESLLLATLGSGLGLLCGLWSVRLLIGLIPASIPTDTGLDARVFAFTFGMTILATVVFGLTPALVASRAEVAETLKAGGVRTGSGRATHTLRSVLVVCQIALALVLLIGAGLLTRSFMRLANAPLGFNPQHVLTAQVSRPMTNGLQTPSQAPFFNAVLQNLRALPGVQSVGATSRVPLSTCDGWTGSIRPSGASTDLQSICTNTVSPDYFRTMEIPLLKGRPFSDQDSNDAPPVVVMNQALAREVFEDRDPIGQQVGLYGLGGLSWHTVIGVVADVKNGALEQKSWPEIFVPYPQALLPLSATFVIRTDGDPLALAGLVRKAVQAVDKDQSVSNLQILDDLMTSATAPQWFRTRMVGLFALLALALAAIGVFGVMAYSVSQRVHEIGVRVVLGARPGDVLMLTVKQGMFTAAIGLGMGIVGALTLTRLLTGFLYDVKPTDVTTFVTALILLGGTALLACYIPARRAARVDPLVALRNE